MDKSKNLGKLGEDLAVDFLVKNNFKLLYRNWKFGRKEIDIIAQKELTLHFIEIKTRNTAKFGYPEENVTPQKIKNMLTVAAHFIKMNPNQHKVQFDVLAIVLKPEISYFFIEDVYV